MYVCVYACEVYMCMCVWYTCICVCACEVHMCTCTGKRTTLGVNHRHNLLFSPNQGLISDLELDK